MGSESALLLIVGIVAFLAIAVAIKFATGG
jgi:hypothetical protein